MKKIAVLTGTRAEYGLLKPVLTKLKNDEDFELCLLVTGMHLEKMYGETYLEIQKDGFQINHKVKMDLKSDKPEEILKSMALELEGLADVFCEERPDMLLLLGDRFEIIMAALCALLNRVPVAHIHGGELTQGVIDDGIRHAVTKLSALHFTSTEVYRERVIQMGENPERVYNVGALGTENIAKISLLSKEELTEKFHIDWSQPVIMVTYHPVTLECHTAAEQFKDLLAVIEEHKEFNYIFTYANADTDGQIINQMIEKYVENRENCRAFVSMGQVGYLSTLKYTWAVVGNSSSGIIEAPSFRIPTINIGERQRGRVKPGTVLDCAAVKKEIFKTFELGVSDSFRKKCLEVQNPYEGVNTSSRIVEIIKQYLKHFKSTEKKFFDINIREER